MKKSFLVLISLALVFFALTACAETATESYSTESFTVSIPSGWIEKTGDNCLYLYARESGVIDGGYIYICETNVGDIALSSLESAYDEILTGMTSSDSYVGDKYSELIEINGDKALLFSYKMNAGVEFYIAGIFYCKDGALLAYTYADGESGGEALREIMLGYAGTVNAGSEPTGDLGGGIGGGLGSLFGGKTVTAPQTDLYDIGHFSVPIPSGWVINTDDNGFISAFAQETGSLEGGYIGTQEYDFSSYGSFEGDELIEMYELVLSGLETNAVAGSEFFNEMYMVGGYPVMVYDFDMQLDAVEHVHGFLYYRDGYMAAFMFTDGEDDREAHSAFIKDCAEKTVFDGAE